MTSNISCVAAVFAAIAILSVSALVAKPKGNLLEFTHLGDIDGVGYYVDSDATMDWTAAYNFCNASEMTLARVETVEQAIFLGNALLETVGSYDFWTQGRDSFTPQSQVWEDTMEPLDSDVFEEFKHQGRDELGLYYCSYVWAGSSKNLYLYVHLCSEQKRVLCQKPVL